MSDQEYPSDIETLARMAASLAGRDPDQFVSLKLGEVLVFKGVMWRYPDFLIRAQAAFDLLNIRCFEFPN
jgi:hypothetical protein